MATRHISSLFLFVVVVRSILAAVLIAGAVLTTLVAILGSIGGGIPIFVWAAAVVMLLLGMMFANFR